MLNGSSRGVFKHQSTGETARTFTPKPPVIDDIEASLARNDGIREAFTRIFQNLNTGPAIEVVEPEVDDVAYRNVRLQEPEAPFIFKKPPDLDSSTVEGFTILGSNLSPIVKAPPPTGIVEFGITEDGELRHVRLLSSDPALVND